MQQGYISFVGTCYFYFMVIKPFLHAQALTEHAKKKKNKFSKWVKILGEKILLSIRLPLKRKKNNYGERSLVGYSSGVAKSLT